MAIIEVKNLTKTFGEKVALDHVSLEIPEGKYILLAFNGEANVNGLSEMEESQAIVAPYSATIIAEY